MADKNAPDEVLLRQKITDIVSRYGAGLFAKDFISTMESADQILAKAREAVEGAGLTEQEIDAKFENDWDGLDRLALVGFVQEDIIQAILKALGGE